MARYPNGAIDVYRRPDWPNPAYAQLAAVRHCPCEDGIRRRARITGEPDTYWSTPAQIRIQRQGRRWLVSGYVTYTTEGPEFRAFTSWVVGIASKLTDLKLETPGYILCDRLAELGHDWLIPFLKERQWQSTR